GAAGAVAAGAAGTGRALAAGAGEADGVCTWSRNELLLGRSIERARLVIMKRPARIVVALDRTLADPRGPKAVWVPPPPKALARSWFLPCWRSTTPIRNRQAMMCRPTTT